MRSPPPAIEARFRVAAQTVSDIHEHLPVLRQYAEQCDHVTELGMRFANGSTVAFLAAAPKTFISWDIAPGAIVSQRVADLIRDLGEDSQISFQPRVGDSLKIEIEYTDLLFIDTLHTYKQLKAELFRHGDPTTNHGRRLADGGCPCKVRKFIILHDTVTFGMKSEDGTEPGLRWAIREFQKNYAFPLWRVEKDFPNNNGLVVLSHV